MPRLLGRQLDLDRLRCGCWETFPRLSPVSWASLRVAPASE